MLYQPLNEAQVAAYLRRLYPERENLRLLAMRRSYPGMSRETWWLTIGWDADGGACSEKLVLRLNPPGGSLAFEPLEQESAIYRCLFDTSVPVPRLIRHETDEAWLLEGREFSLREWIDGEVEPAVLSDRSPSAQPAKAAIVRELMNKLALLHGLDWQALGIGAFLRPPSDPQNCAREDIERHLQILDEHAQEPQPLLRELGRWLLENPPPPPARVVLRKENNGIGEEIWRDGKIVAMCDWETASLGDAALDLAVAMRTTAIHWDAGKALDYYNSIAPDPVSPQSVAWYLDFWRFKAAVALHCGLRQFTSGRDRRVQLLALGMWSIASQYALVKAAEF